MAGYTRTSYSGWRFHAVASGCTSSNENRFGAQWQRRARRFQKCVPYLRGPRAASFTPLPCRVAHRIDRVCPNGPGQPGPTTLQRRARRFHIALSVLLLLLLLLLYSFFPLQGDVMCSHVQCTHSVPQWLGSTGADEAIPALAHRIDRVCSEDLARFSRTSLRRFSASVPRRRHVLMCTTHASQFQEVCPNGPGQPGPTT